MLRGDLRGLPALMNALVEFPPADEVVECLALGPFAHLDVYGTVLVAVDGEDLVLIGSRGYSEGELAAFQRIPLTMDIPLTQCVRDLVAVTTSTEEMEERYTLPDEVQGAWQELRSRNSGNFVLTAPITSEGVAIGAFAVRTHTEPDWTATDLSLIDALSSVLGLWLSNPAVSPLGVDDESESLSLTARQRAILQLVLSGRSNAAIASLLHCSVSTIKQELHLVNIHLGTHDRVSAAQRAYALGLLADQVLA